VIVRQLSRHTLYVHTTNQEDEFKGTYTHINHAFPRSVRTVFERLLADVFVCSSIP
jgi:hypothetical protein